MVDFQPFEDWQGFRGDEQFDASGDAGLTADQPGAFERDDHLVDRWRADPKVALQVGFGGRASKHVRVSVDEGQVLALRFGEAFSVSGA
jgi:hypothetical protein